MTDHFPTHDTTREDLRIQTKWARRLAVVYGVALLLLVAFVAANRMVAESNAEPGVASAPASYVVERASAMTPRHRN